MYRVPSAMVTARDLVVGGTTIAAGTTLTSAQLAQITTLQSLLADGSITASPDLYGRRTRAGNPQPTYVNPDALKAFTAALVAAEEAAAAAAAAEGGE